MKTKNQREVAIVDLVMWTKNGAKTLPLVLERIDEVIPKDAVAKKIIINDHSTDNTVEIAKKFGWEVYENPASGIASGANEALRRVTSQFFISFEQDVVLTKNWWPTIPKYMLDKEVACAQGIRTATHPVLRKLDEYVAERQVLFMLSIDNNIYKTEVIREIGGFPATCPICIDRNLWDKILDARYKWIIDKNVVSDHIRPGIVYELKHKYNTYLNTRKPEAGITFRNMVRIFAFSPLRALHIVWKTRRPEILYVYPLIRFFCLKAFLDRGRRNDNIDVRAPTLPSKRF